jgi:hypothetical protein
VLSVSKTGATTAKVGDSITYLVTAAVAAGSPAAAVLVLDEVLSSNVAQFVEPLPDSNSEYNSLSSDAVVCIADHLS